jgi:hypothetical protein
LGSPVGATLVGLGLRGDCRRNPPRPS